MVNIIVVNNQKFCVGLADRSVHEFASSGAKLWPGVVGAVVNVARAENALSSSLAIFCAAQIFRSGSRDYQRWPSVYGVVLAVANSCKAVVNGNER